jgi:hypothetical protein
VIERKITIFTSSVMLNIDYETSSARVFHHVTPRIVAVIIVAANFVIIGELLQLKGNFEYQSSFFKNNDQIQRFS